MGHVQRAVPAHGRSEGAPEHPGEVPGRARAVRRRARRRAQRDRPGGVPIPGVGPHTVRGIRAVERRGTPIAVRAVGATGSVAVHVSVLVDEVAFLLRPRREGWVIDGTVGMGGHAEALLGAAPAGVRLLGLDVDPEALARSRARLGGFGDRVTLAHASFRDVAATATAHGVTQAESILLDLGVSSQQLEESARGFSFQADEPLDMRLDPTAGPTAAALLNRLPEPELTRVLTEYGDEPHARRIARAIVRRRPLRTTTDLVATVRSAVPRGAWPKRLHVATRTFLAIRMAVNDEPGALREALPQAAGLLAPGGRLGVIAFHSGEDRIVKRTFRELSRAEYAEIEPSPRVPTDDEVRANPRARTAKLRVLERIQ